MNILHISIRFKVKDLLWNNTKFLQGLSDTITSIIDLYELANIDLLKLAHNRREYIIHNWEKIRCTCNNQHETRSIHKNIPQFLKENTILHKYITLVKE